MQLNSGVRCVFVAETLRVLSSFDKPAQDLIDLTGYNFGQPHVKPHGFSELISLDTAIIILDFSFPESLF